MNADNELHVSWETGTWVGSGEGRRNEDFALVAPAGRCAVLVDGATGLTKVNLVPGESDAAWYARTLAQHLVARLADPACATTDALVAAQPRHTTSFPARPSSSASTSPTAASPSCAGTTRRSR